MEVKENNQTGSGKSLHQARFESLVKTDSINEMGTRIIVSLGDGLFAGLLFGALVLIILRFLSRGVFHIPSNVVSKIGSLVFALVVLWAAVKIYVMMMP